MRRVVLLAALAAALAVPAGPARAAGVFNGRIIGAFYQSGSTYVSVVGSVYEDITGTSQSSYGNVYVSTSNGTDSGTGTLDVSLDPTGTAGRLTGTIQGNLGPITVDVAFLGTSVSSGNVPGLYADLDPGAPQVTAIYAWSRFGHTTMSVSSSVGSVSGVIGNGNCAYGIFATLP